MAACGTRCTSNGHGIQTFQPGQYGLITVKSTDDESLDHAGGCPFYRECVAQFSVGGVIRCAH